MGLFGGLAGKLIGVLLLVVVLAVAIGVYAYATDYGVEATVAEKDCDLRPPNVTVKTKLGGVTDTVEVDSMECFLIKTGHFVVYHIRSQRTVIYEREDGRCLYDSYNRLC